MKKNIKFDKSIEFATMIGEVCSISLEHSLKFVDQSSIEGEFIVEGSYKLTEASQLTEKFSHKIPVEILLNECLELDSSVINIVDFYYEIENDNTMICHIEVEVSGVEQLIIEKIEDVSIISEELEEKVVDTNVLEVRECDMDKKVEVSIDKTIDEDKEEVEPVKNLFSSFSTDEESYSTYSVYIMRSNDTIEYVLDKYKVSKDDIIQYNNLDNLEIGSKIIIPCCNE